MCDLHGFTSISGQLNQGSRSNECNTELQTEKSFGGRPPRRDEKIILKRILGK